MPVDLFGAKVDEAGRVIFSPEPTARKIFFELVFERPECAEFVQHRSTAAMMRLADVLEVKFLNKQLDISVDNAVARAIRMERSNQNSKIGRKNTAHLNVPNAQKLTGNTLNGAAANFKLRVFKLASPWPVCRNVLPCLVSANPFLTL